MVLLHNIIKVFDASQFSSFGKSLVFFGIGRRAPCVELSVGCKAELFDGWTTMDAGIPRERALPQKFFSIR